MRPARTDRWCTCWVHAGCGSVRSRNSVGGTSTSQAGRLRVARSVTLVDGVFEVGTPKNGKGRTVSLPGVRRRSTGSGRARRAGVPGLRGRAHAREQCAAAVVVAGRRGRRAVPPEVVDAAGEQTTVYDFKLHELRHTAASWPSRLARTSRRCRTCSATSPRR